MQNTIDASGQQLRGEHQEETEAHRRYGWLIQMFVISETTAGQQRDLVKRCKKNTCSVYR